MILEAMFLVVSSAVRADLSSAGLLKVEVTCKEIFDKASGETTYTYVVANSKASLQAMVQFSVATDDADVGDGGTIRNLASPTARPWTEGIPMYDIRLSRSIVGWRASGPEYRDLEEARLPRVGVLPPGESVTGFSFSSRGLPALQSYFAEGFVSRPSEDEVVARAGQLGGTTYANVDNIPDSIMERVLTSASQDVDSGVAVGPDHSSVLLIDSAGLVARLAEIKDETMKMGWIKDPGTVTSLNKKLAAARKALGRAGTGKVAAAKLLQAFVNELEAQRGKHVNENAYFLLKANADYLLQTRLR